MKFDDYGGLSTRVGDSLPRIFRDVSGCDLDWPIDDNLHFDDEHRALLESMCDEYGVPFQTYCSVVRRRKAGLSEWRGALIFINELIRLWPGVSRGR